MAVINVINSFIVAIIEEEEDDDEIFERTEAELEERRRQSNRAGFYLLTLMERKSKDFNAYGRNLSKIFQVCKRNDKPVTVGEKKFTT